MITDLPHDWGNILFEGKNKTLCAPGPRRNEKRPHKRLAREWPGVSGGGVGQPWPVVGSGSLNTPVLA